MSELIEVFCKAAFCAAKIYTAILGVLATSLVFSATCSIIAVMYVKIKFFVKPPEEE